MHTSQYDALGKPNNQLDGNLKICTDQNHLLNYASYFLINLENKLNHKEKIQYGTFEIPRNDGFRSTFIHFDHVILRNCRANCLHRNKMALRYVQQTKRCVVLKRGRARTIPVITGVLCQVVHRMEERRPIQTFIRGCKVSSFIRIQDQSVNLNYDGNGFNKFFETKTILLNDTTRTEMSHSNTELSSYGSAPSFIASLT